tara:strand:- start:4690 stop:14934 length:10245 start_codon:yes stop_codon:yes gene_type:complete
MPEIKNTFLKGRMNKDLDERLVPNGEYRDALNINVSTSEDSDIGTAQTILGNIRIEDIVDIDFICIGSIANEKTNKLYWFLKNDNEGTDAILEYDGNIDEVFHIFTDIKSNTDEPVLRFPNRTITGINIIDNLLFWTDGEGEPKKINIDDCKDGTIDLYQHTQLVVLGDELGDIREEDITVIKKKPTLAPVAIPNFIQSTIQDNTYNQKTSLFEKVFSRFAFRYKYKDNEYSAFGPFSNVVFNPQYVTNPHKKNNAASFEQYNNETSFSINEPFNATMVNKIDTIDIYNFVLPDMPRGVVEIEILYKQEDSPVIYSIAKLNKKDTEGYWDFSGFNEGANLATGSSIQGKYTITTENIYAALPENQFIRVFDTVPKKALGQEITGNRLVYANYTQGYNMDVDTIGNELYSIQITADYEKRINDASLNFDITPLRSLKSLRNYQVGIVFGDEYGRETPVFTSADGAVSVPWADSSNEGNASSSLSLKAQINSNYPNWASYFKFYIKETSTEYYNLIMDKAYVPSSQDEKDRNVSPNHIWISFFSSDRNKIDIEDHIILKTVINDETEGQYPYNNKFKIIDIQNEAPDSISYEFHNIASISNEISVGSTEGNLSKVLTNLNHSIISVDTDTLEFDVGNFHDLAIGAGGTFGPRTGYEDVKAANNQDYFISWYKLGSDGTRVYSQDYRVRSVLGKDGTYRVKLQKRIVASDTNLAQNASGDLHENVFLNVFRKQRKEPDQFSGRFFVKVLFDYVVNDIRNIAEVFDFTVVASAKMKYWLDKYDDPNGTLNYDEVNKIVNVDSTINDYDTSADATIGTVILGNTHSGSNIVNKEESDWSVLYNHCHDGSISNAFFIDNMYFAAGQSNKDLKYAKYATDVLSGQSVGSTGSQYTFATWENRHLRGIPPTAGATSLLKLKPNSSTPMYDAGNYFDYLVHQHVSYTGSTSSVGVVNPQDDFDDGEDFITAVTAVNPGSFVSGNFVPPITQSNWTSNTLASTPSTNTGFNYQAPNAVWADYRWYPFAKDSSVGYYFKQFGTGAGNVGSAGGAGAALANTMVGLNVNHPWVTADLGTTVDWSAWDNYIKPIYSQSITSSVDFAPEAITNSMQGIFTSTTQHTIGPSTSAAYLAGNLDAGSKSWLSYKNSDNQLRHDNIYGQDDGKIFMHLSFLGPGRDLVPDNLDLTNADIKGPNCIGAYLQGIHGGGVFTKSVKDGLDNGWEFKSTPEWNSPQVIECEGTSYDTYKNLYSQQLNIGKNPNYQDLHYDQWSPTKCINGDSNNEITDFLQNLFFPQSRFRFSGDPNGAIYTIKSIKEKYLYNHTPWKRRYVKKSSYTSSSTFQEIGDFRNEINIQPGGDSVEEAAVAWAKAKEDNDFLLASKTNALEQKIIDFGKANNRRVVYILELVDENGNPLDPRIASSGFNPVDADSDGSGIVAANGDSRMEFLNYLPGIVSGNISNNPAIWETEPRENKDLEVYYEASNALPTKLNVDTSELYAPVGCRVEALNRPGSLNGQITLSECNITGYSEHTDGRLILETTGFNAIDAAGNVITYADPNPGFGLAATTCILKCIRNDGSYTIFRAVDSTIDQPFSTLGNITSNFVVIYQVGFDFGLSWYNSFSLGNGIESNRIRDEFNKMQITNGARASAVLDEPYAEENRKNGLIYSGIYNSTSSVNNLNQFIIGEKITKDLNPTYGSIQKLFQRRVSLIAFCEDRVVSIVSNKDSLFNADGKPQLISSTNVLGDANPFIGNYGISKNPESFASESYRAYFTDKARGAVLRLSKDGLTPISDAGMKDWFRDNLSNYDVILGSYDSYNDDYNISLITEVELGYNFIKNSFLDYGDISVTQSSNPELIQNNNFNNSTNTNWPSVVSNILNNEPDQTKNPDLIVKVDITEYMQIPENYFLQPTTGTPSVPAVLGQPPVYDTSAGPTTSGLFGNAEAQVSIYRMSTPSPNENDSYKYNIFKTPDNNDGSKSSFGPPNLTADRPGAQGLMLLKRELRGFSPLRDTTDAGNYVNRPSDDRGVASQAGSTLYDPTYWQHAWGNIYYNWFYGLSNINNTNNNRYNQYNFLDYIKQGTSKSINPSDQRDVITFDYNYQIYYEVRSGIYNNTYYGKQHDQLQIVTDVDAGNYTTTTVPPNNPFQFIYQALLKNNLTSVNNNTPNDATIYAGESITIDIGYIVELGPQYLYDYFPPQNLSGPNGGGPTYGFGDPNQGSFGVQPQSLWKGYKGGETQSNANGTNGSSIKDNSGLGFSVSKSNPLPNLGNNNNSHNTVWPYFQLSDSGGNLSLNGNFRNPWNQPFAHEIIVELTDGSNIINNDLLVDSTLDLNDLDGSGNLVDNEYRWENSSGNQGAWVNTYQKPDGSGNLIDNTHYTTYSLASTKTFAPDIFKVYGNNNQFGVVKMRIKYKFKDWIDEVDPNFNPTTATQEELKRASMVVVEKLNVGLRFRCHDYDGVDTRNRIHLFELSVQKNDHATVPPTFGTPAVPGVPGQPGVPSYTVPGIAAVNYIYSNNAQSQQDILYGNIQPSNLNLFPVTKSTLADDPINLQDLIMQSVVGHDGLTYTWTEIDPSAVGTNFYGQGVYQIGNVSTLTQYDTHNNTITSNPGVPLEINDEISISPSGVLTSTYLKFFTESFISDNYYLIDIVDDPNTSNDTIFVDGFFDQNNLPANTLNPGDNGYPSGHFGETNIFGLPADGIKFKRVNRVTLQNHFDYDLDGVFNYVPSGEEPTALRAIVKAHAGSSVITSQNGFSISELHLRVNEYSGTIKKIVIKNLGNYALMPTYPTSTPINLPDFGSVVNWHGSFSSDLAPVYHAMSVPIQYVRNNEIHINSFPQFVSASENTLWTQSGNQNRYIGGKHTNASMQYVGTNSNEAPQPSNDGYEIIFEVGNEHYSNQMTRFRFLYRSYDNATTERKGFAVADIDTPGTYRAIANFDGNTTLPNGNPWSLELDTGSGFTDISNTSSNAALIVDNGTTGSGTNWQNWYGSYYFLPYNNSTSFIASIKSLSARSMTSVLTFTSVNAADDWVFSGFDATFFEENILWDNGSILINSTNQPTLNWTGQHQYVYAAQQLRNPITNALARLEANKKYVLKFDITRISGTGNLEMFYINGATDKGFQIIESYTDHAIGQTDTVEKLVEILDFTSSNYVIYDYHDIKDYFVIIPTSDSIVSHYRIDNITLRETPENYDLQSYTLSYSEDVRGWTSFKSFIPESGVSLSKKYYTFKEAALYQHNLGDIYNNFYGIQYDSSITAVLNAEPSVIKSFKTLGYEGTQARVKKYQYYTDGSLSFQDLRNNFTQGEIYGSHYNLKDKNGWYVHDITTNKQQGVVKEFLEKEGKWFNYIKGKEDLTTEYISKHIADFSFRGIGVINGAVIVPDPIISSGGTTSGTTTSNTTSTTTGNTTGTTTGGGGTTTGGGGGTTTGGGY